MADKRYNPTIIEEVFGAAAVAATIVSSPLLRPWYRKWGATAAEVNMALPGDDLAPNPRVETTRAISIQAPAAAIWPWLAQMGQGRAGLYSYERLENLARCDMANADEIIPELQDLKVGDQVRLGPEGHPYSVVTAIEPGRALVLRFGEPDAQIASPTWIWVFYLEPINEETTRLIIRSRLEYEPNLGNVLMWRVFTDPISFVMERKMLQGIKVRAEASASN